MFGKTFHISFYRLIKDTGLDTVQYCKVLIQHDLLVTYIINEGFYMSLCWKIIIGNRFC